MKRNETFIIIIFKKRKKEIGNIVHFNDLYQIVIQRMEINASMNFVLDIIRYNHTSIICTKLSRKMLSSYHACTEFFDRAPINSSNLQQ